MTKSQKGTWRRQSLKILHAQFVKERSWIIQEQSFITALTVSGMDD